MKQRSCGILLEYKNKFLLVKSWGGNIWGIPKGVQEDGETQVEAAVRETLEESGIAASDPVYFMEYSTKRKNFTVFRAGVTGKEFKSNQFCLAIEGRKNPEIDAFAWVDKESAMVLTAGTHAQRIFEEL